MLIELNVDSPSSSSLFKLLIKASVSAKHEIIYKCKAAKHQFCQSEVSGWRSAPLVFLPAQVCTSARSHPQTVICWRHVEEKQRQKGQVCRNTPIKKKSILRSASDWYPSGTKRKKMTNGVCWTSCICGRSLSNKRSSSPAAEDSQIPLPPHLPALSESTFSHHSLKIPAVLSALVCPEFLCI